MPAPVFVVFLIFFWGSSNSDRYAFMKATLLLARFSSSSSSSSSAPSSAPAPKTSIVSTTRASWRPYPSMACYRCSRPGTSSSLCPNSLVPTFDELTLLRPPGRSSAPSGSLGQLSLPSILECCVTSYADAATRLSGKGTVEVVDAPERQCWATIGACAGPLPPLFIAP